MRRAFLPLTVVCALAALGAAAAAQQAQQAGGQGPVASVRPAEQPNPVGQYAGVTPGTGNLPPRAPAPGAGPVVVTWPGFQARPDGASRFFVQTSGPVTTEVVSERGRAVVLLRGTGIHLTNNRRWLETRFFNTPVTRARVERRRRDAAIVLELRADVMPRVSSEPAPNGYHFVYVEFPPGAYVSAEEAPAGAVEPAPAPQPGG